MAANGPEPGEAALADPAYPGDEEPDAADEVGAEDETMRPDEPLDPLAVDTPGAEPELTDGSFVGVGRLTDGTVGVGTVGVWIGGTGTGTGGGAGAGTLIVGMGRVGVVTVGVGTETEGTEIVVGTVSFVGTVSAGLE